MTDMEFVEIMKQEIDGLWEALKETCCKNPDSAQMIVFLTRKKFDASIATWLSEKKNESECLETPAKAISDTNDSLEFSALPLMDILRITNRR